MHLLAAQPGAVSDGTEPIDPGQSPADLVVISAADTELAALSEARGALGTEAPTLRLANLGWLAHPYSVDLYLDQTALGSRLVVVRLLGGRAYWPYGLEQFATRLRLAGVPFAVVPGDDKPDPELADLTTLAPEHAEALWAYCVEGGPENAANFLRYARHLLDDAQKPPPARPLLRAGYYWPGAREAGPETLAHAWTAGAPVAAIVFYRALLAGAGLNPVNQLVAALQAEGLNPLPVFVASLKDPVSAATLARVFGAHPPDIVLNATSFAVGTPGATAATPLDAPGRPVLQVLLSAMTEEAWRGSERGLGARDIAMNVALPEIDGRVLAGAIGFKSEAYRDAATQCSIAVHRGQASRIAHAARLAAAWVRLGRTPAQDRHVALILANYPNKDGRLANGVGLDTPASTVAALSALRDAGYRVDAAPADGAELMAAIQAGPTNWLADRASRQGGVRLPMAEYRRHYGALASAVRARIESRWGQPEDDPFAGPEGFALSILTFGHAVVGVQPARGYNIDPEETYHAPDLAPPHNYLAFYIWLREVFGAHALVHMGKHGNLEWLPGKAVGLSGECMPEAVLGAIPNIYPFIVNDPGEGTQAKRRSSAVIVDHLTPPLTRAETYGELAELEGLVDELYEAMGVDARRAAHLRKEILARLSGGVGEDAGLGAAQDEDEKIQRLDAWLCEIKESQIRDGLHVFGASPEGVQARDLTLALARLPRGGGAEGDASLLRALAADLALGDGFDPLAPDMAAPWAGVRPAPLMEQPGAWRHEGDTVERLETLAAALVGGSADAPGPASAAVLARVATEIRPALARSGPSEMSALLAALDGRFLPPGPSGAPTRGRLDVLPTGRNFYSVDTRAVPTRAAWELGWRSASALIERHLEEEGDYPRSLALSAWGTANMRTGGDDIAQALALMGVRPVWDDASRRVTGFEILPIDSLGRPRVDVTLRISGFFRDAFPAQVDLVASAARSVMELDENEDDNPAAARARREAAGVGKARAQARVFGSKPGAYGAGLQALIDERGWETRGDLAEAYLSWGAYAYGAGDEGRPDRDALEARLTSAEIVLHNQDNREHDLLDSDDYYQFEGGLAATVEALSGRAPRVYHADHSRPENPRIHTLEEEIARVLRARVVNPKWLAGCRRHGYKGAFEMAATVDYLFAFAATTRAVRGHHFDLVHTAYLEDDETRAFLEEANPSALREIAERLAEAIARGLWQPRANTAQQLIDRLRGPAP